MYDEDVDHYYASVIGPMSINTDEYYDANSAHIYYVGDIVIPSTIIVGSIEVPVEGIDHRAFCYSEEDLDYPEKIAAANRPKREKEMPPTYGFPITSITFPNTLLWIGGAAFEDCDQLKSINFGNNLQEIYSNAFSGCSSLTSITIPASVKK